MRNRWVRFAVGGLTLSVLIFLMPPLYGEGFESITRLINGDVTAIFNNSPFYSFRNNTVAVLLFLFALGAFKVFATAATNGGGGVALSTPPLR